MIKLDNSNNITFICGDTGTLTIMLQDAAFKDGDTLTLTVAESLQDEESTVISKVLEPTEGNSVDIDFTAEDTNLEVGSYYYDVQLNRIEPDEVHTIIGPAKFKVAGGVTV